MTFDDQLLEYAQTLIRAALEQHGGSKTLAAKALGISRSRVYRYLARIEGKRHEQQAVQTQG